MARALARGPERVENLRAYGSKFGRCALPPCANLPAHGTKRAESKRNEALRECLDEDGGRKRAPPSHHQDLHLYAAEPRPDTRSEIGPDARDARPKVSCNSASELIRFSAANFRMLAFKNAY